MVLEGTEGVAIPEVEGADEEGNEDEELPSRARIHGAARRRNESLENFRAISLWA